MRKPKPAKAEPAPKSMRKPEPAPAKAESAPKAQPAAVESEPAPESMRKPESARDEEAPRSMRRSERAAAKPTEPAAPPSREKEVVPGNEKAPLPAANARVHDVELGAHSGSNFYKGLSGIDVIEHGGLFVATYKVPKLGQPVAIRVHLPGDLEFEADAIVRWTRDAGGDESDPGFGARFTRISGEGRQLVYRYVRNREPMFYDDL
jgi:Tfp pilus assembly protein PilZ